MFYQIITYLHFYFIRTPPLTHTHHQSFILSFYFEHICLLLLFEFCVLLLWIWQNSYLSWSKVMALCESIFFVDCLYLVALASWLGLECSQVWSPDPGWSLGSAMPEVTLGSWTGEAWSRTVPGKCCTWGWLSKVAEVGVGTGWEGSPWGMLGHKPSWWGDWSFSGTGQGESWGTQTVVGARQHLCPQRGLQPFPACLTEATELVSGNAFPSFIV